MTTVLQYAADWLLTWLMHTTVACVLMLIGGRWLVADPRLRDLLWKAALLLPLGTSLVSVSAHPITSSSLQLATFAREHLPFAGRSAQVSMVTTGVLANTAMIRVEDPMVQWLRLLILAAVLVPAVFATGRLVQMRRKFRKDLSTRLPTDAEELGIDARALYSGNQTTRISLSPQVVSAAAIGRHEICVSASFLTLGRTERQCVLAHEIAHLQRHDPAWVAFADFVTCVLAVQPLVRIVAHRLRRDTEFICDEIAVSKTGNPVAYVRTLALFAKEHYATPAAALAYGSSPIVQRAERVLGLHSRYRRPRARIAVMFVAAIVLIALLSLPRVGTGEAAGRVHAQVSRQVSSAGGPQAQINVTLEMR